MTFVATVRYKCPECGCTDSSIIAYDTIEQLKEAIISGKQCPRCYRKHGKDVAMKIGGKV